MTPIPPAIVDTNVVVAGLLTARGDSPVARLLDGMVAAAFPFVVSEALLAEYRQVMARPRLQALHELDEGQLDAILLELAQHAIVLAPPPSPPDAPDPGDQHLWDLLRMREDLLLVTGDLRLHGAPGMRRRILRPAAFADMLLRPPGDEATNPAP